jgi:hypothetical protein
VVTVEADIYVKLGFLTPSFSVLCSTSTTQAVHVYVPTMIRFMADELRDPYEVIQVNVTRHAHTHPDQILYILPEAQGSQQLELCLYCLQVIHCHLS